MIAQILNLAFCRVHSRVFLRARTGIIFGLHRPLVHKHKPYVGFISADRSDTCINPHIILHGQIIIAIRCLQTALLAQNAVEKSVHIQSIVIIELNQKISRIDRVHPLRTVLYLITDGFSGNRITEYYLPDGLSAEQPDIKFFHRTDPVRSPFFVHLEAKLIKNIGRIAEPQMTVNIPVEVFRLGIFDIAAFRKPHTLCILRSHVNGDVCRNAFTHIGQPFDWTGIDQRRYTHRFVLIIDLRIQTADFELGHHVDQ